MIIYNSQKNKNFQNEENEIIIEIEISNEEIGKEIYILCDKDTLIKNNKENESYYKENNMNPIKLFNYYNKENTNYI